MPTTLGSAFVPQPTVSPEQIEPAELALLAAVQELTEKVANLEIPAPQVTVPAPQVRVDVPPLPAVPTAAEIGRAVASAIPAKDDSRVLGALGDMRDAVTALAKKQSAPRFGGGSALAMGLPTLMNAAPASDTGQDALPVRIISQLGAGTGGSGGGLTDTELRATPVPVSGTVVISNFPATQPVSIAAVIPVSGNFWQTTQPVSGTFWQVTQPVSGPLTDTQLRASAVPVTGSGTAGTPATGVQTVQGIAGGKALPVARTIDGSRTRVSVNYNSSTPAVADTLLTVSLNKGGTVTSVATVPVTAGKVFRITSVVVGLRATVATLPFGVVTLRINDSGAAVLTSPAVYQVPVSGTAAAIGNTGTTVASVEDGLELSGTAQLGVSFSNNLITNVASISIIGYEYTP